jgi:LacI family transcriptional regulator
MQKHKKTTIKDIAGIAGVSVASVSRVLRSDPSVSSEIRDLVEEALKKSDYEVKPSQYEKNHRRKIGLIIPDITNPYFPHLISGITNIALVHNLEIVLGNSHNNIEIEKAHFEQMTKNGVQGIIYIPFSSTPNPHLKGLIEDRYPIVFLDREVHTNGICSVTSDNEEGAYQATNYLLNLGHRDIVFISGPRHLSTSTTRRAGFLKGLSEFGVEWQEHLELCGDTTLESGYQVTGELLSLNRTHFSAIFASNDLMAYGAWRAVEEKGLKVPGDISIIGYDDIPFSSILSLTTIAQPGYEIGRNALMLLVDLIDKLREPPQKIILRDSLVIRKSCKKI